MATGKKPKKSGKKSKRGGGGWFKKLFLLIILLTLAFFVAGFWAPGGKTLLSRLDEATELRIFQSSYDKALSKGREAWAWAFQTSDKTADKPAEPQKHPPKGKEGRSTHTVIGPNGKNHINIVPQKMTPRVVEEKRKEGVVLKKLDSMQKPLSNPTPEQQKELDEIIKKKTQGK